MKNILTLSPKKQYAVPSLYTDRGPSVFEITGYAKGHRAIISRWYRWILEWNVAHPDDLMIPGQLLYMGGHPFLVLSRTPDNPDYFFVIAKTANDLDSKNACMRCGLPGDPVNICPGEDFTQFVVLCPICDERDADIHPLWPAENTPDWNKLFAGDDDDEEDDD